MRWIPSLSGIPRPGPKNLRVMDPRSQQDAATRSDHRLPIASNPSVRVSAPLRETGTGGSRAPCSTWTGGVREPNFQHLPSLALNFAPAIFLALAAIGALPAHAATERMDSPNRLYSVHMDFADSPDAPIRYRSATLIDQRTGRAIQSLTTGDLDFDRISVCWSPDSTLVAVYLEHKRSGWTDVYRIRDAGHQMLEMPEFPLPTKRDLKQPAYSRFDYREPIRWKSPDTLILNCTGKVQLLATNQPGTQFLPEWVNYRYRVEVQFPRDAHGNVKGTRRVSLQHETEAP
jgi:hypothetical protein